MTVFICSTSGWKRVWKWMDVWYDLSKMLLEIEKGDCDWLVCGASIREDREQLMCVFFLKRCPRRIDPHKTSIASVSMFLSHCIVKTVLLMGWYGCQLTFRNWRRGLTKPVSIISSVSALKAGRGTKTAHCDSSESWGFWCFSLFLSHTEKNPNISKHC